MRLSALITVLIMSVSSVTTRADDWPPEFLRGAWLITHSSSDDEEVEEAKDNLLVFHDNRMIFAVDRNYCPPNPEVAAMGYEFYAIKTSNSKCVGLIRVQRGKLKFMLEHSEENGNETIAVTVEDYAGNRVREVVKFVAQRLEIESARERVSRLLTSPKLKVAHVTASYVDALEDWVNANEIGEPSVEREPPMTRVLK